MPAENNTIRELAELFGVTSETLRYYERLGLLNPKREKSGNRLYSHEDFQTLRITREWLQIGCSLKEISDMYENMSIEDLKAIDDGVYYAVKEYNMTRGKYGGIVTNENAEVVDSDGHAIPGLYAAGIISSGAFFGDFCPGGEALGVGAHMGFIAGRNAAEKAK